MARTKKVQHEDSLPHTRRRRATTPEGRENQLIAMAYDVAEQQLAEGTISSQVLTQLLRAGSAKGRAELKKLERENELLRAKTESIQSAKRTDELYANALRAMQNYSGLETGDDSDL